MELLLELLANHRDPGFELLVEFFAQASRDIATNGVLEVMGGCFHQVGVAPLEVPDFGGEAFDDCGHR